MKGLGQKYVLTTQMIICILSLVSCSSTNRTVVKPNTENFVISAQQEIQVLFPEVTIEHLTKKQPLPEGEVNIKEISQRVQRLAVEEIQKKGILLIGLEPPETEGNLLLSSGGVPETLSQRLVRSNLHTPAALELLREVCKESISPAMLVHSLQVKIGSEEGAEVQGVFPIWVGIVPIAGMRASYLRAILRDCKTGEILWRNEVLFRSLPQVGDMIFENTVRELSLYRTKQIKVLKIKV